MFHFSRRPLLIGMFLMASLSCAALASAQSVYVTGAGNEFGTLDVTTGAFTSITTTAPMLTGLTFAPGGTLYGVDIDGNDLYTINTTTGALTAIGSTGLVGTTVVGLASASNGALFLLDQDTNTSNSSLYTLDPATGAATLKGALGNASSGTLAFLGNTLYESDDEPSAMNPLASDVLNVLDPSTGTAAPIGMGTGAQFVYGLAAVNGTLYGFDDNKNIMTIDPSNGTANFLGTYALPNGDSIYAATFPIAAVPEPSAFALMVGMGATGAGFLSRRRKQSRKVA